MLEVSMTSKMRKREYEKYLMDIDDLSEKNQKENSMEILMSQSL